MPFPLRPKAVLLDIEGTLTHRGTALPGAGEAVAHIRRRGLGLRLLTNITAKSPACIAAELAAMGIQIAPGEIHTAATACLAHLHTLQRTRPGLRCALLLPKTVRPLFADIPDIRQNPDTIVLGDLGDGFTHALLNQALRWMQAGAQLMALQRNPFWFAADGPRLDCGAYVAALEAATGATALVTGKPSPMFFAQALEELDCPPHRALVVGDDLRTDAAGAAVVGSPFALVGSGKWQPGQEAGLGAGDHFLPGVSALPALLDQLLAQS